MEKSREVHNTMYTYDQLQIRPLHEEDIYKAFDLEKKGYPEDEAASQDIMTYRQREAPELFRGCFQGEELLGDNSMNMIVMVNGKIYVLEHNLFQQAPFISATRYHESVLNEEAMKMHIPNGESVCIHSVCVKEACRRKGIASHMLRDFINFVNNHEKDVKRILLICKSKLIPLYTKAGFVFKCKSDVVHGKETWYELEIEIKGKDGLGNEHT